MTEAEVQRQIIEELELRGHMVFRMNAGRGRVNQRLAPTGTPDLLVVTRGGEVLWIEVKAPGGKLKESQQQMHFELTSRQQSVLVAFGSSDIARI